MTATHSAFILLFSVCIRVIIVPKGGQCEINVFGSHLSLCLASNTYFWESCKLGYFSELVIFLG